MKSHSWLKTVKTFLHDRLYAEALSERQIARTKIIMGAICNMFLRKREHQNTNFQKLVQDHCSN